MNEDPEYRARTQNWREHLHEYKLSLIYSLLYKVKGQNLTHTAPQTK